MKWLWEAGESDDEFFVDYGDSDEEYLLVTEGSDVLLLPNSFLGMGAL